jgi:phospholipase/carboxylesterase/glyoxalase family protein
MMTGMIGELGGFIHRYVPAKGEGVTTTLLLLHGTGGSETDMLSLAMELLPEAAMLSARGKVLEGGNRRFFRRVAEGVFDLEDLKFRTYELANFVTTACEAYHLDPTGVVAVGYSNGANIAAGLLLLRPEVLEGAVLFRPMTPLVPKDLPDLSGVPVLISAGLHDPLVSREESGRLADLLTRATADVGLRWLPAGHELSQEDVDLAREWLREKKGVLG